MEFLNTWLVQQTESSAKSKNCDKGTFGFCNISVSWYAHLNVFIYFCLSPILWHKSKWIIPDFSSFSIMVQSILWSITNTCVPFPPSSRWLFSLFFLTCLTLMSTHHLISIGTRTRHTQLHMERLNWSVDSPASSQEDPELSGGSRSGVGLMVDVEEETAAQLELLGYKVTNLTNRFPTRISTFKHQFL